MTDLFKDREHLFRMAALFLVGLGVFLIVRAYLVPKGFGEYGHYRPGALEDNRSLPLHYAGRAACAECHSDVVDLRKGSKHERIGCESCHGPLAQHAADPDALTPKRPDKKKVCLTCHLTESAKPPRFPQVDPKEHGGSGGCDECHKPHHPEIS